MLAPDVAHGWLYAGGASFGATQSLLRVDLAAGSVDSAWKPTAPNFPEGSVHGISGTEASGDVIVGSAVFGDGVPGILQKVSGSGIGTVDASWAPSADSSINTLVGDHTGKIYVGGGFTALNAQPRRGFAAFGDPEVIFADAFEGF